MKLVSLALKHINNLRIDKREILKKSPSYAYQTFKEIQKENPDDDLVWIMGLDSFLKIETWYKYENFLKEVNLLILERPGYKIDETSFINDLLASKRILNFHEFKNAQGKIFLLQINPVEITSTKIRNLIFNNEDASALLNKDVYQFIKVKNLYKEI